jgi:hypothetical protein
MGRSAQRDKPGLLRQILRLGGIAHERGRIIDKKEEKEGHLRGMPVIGRDSQFGLPTRASESFHFDHRGPRAIWG